MVLIERMKEKSLKNKKTLKIYSIMENQQYENVKKNKDEPINIKERHEIEEKIKSFKYRKDAEYNVQVLTQKGMVSFGKGSFKG